MNWHLKNIVFMRVDSETGDRMGAISVRSEGFIGQRPIVPEVGSEQRE